MKKTGIGKIVSATIAAAAILFAFVSCGRAAESYRSAEPAMTKEAAFGYSEESGGAQADLARAPAEPSSADKPAPGASAPAVDQPAPPQTARKLIRSAYLRLRVQSLATGERAAAAVAATLGGYVASTNVSEYSVSMTIRVPQATFDQAMASLEPVGKAMARNVSAEDVTLRYHDLEGEIASKRALADKFREYLRKATTIDDILAVEARLSEVLREIDRVTTEFKQLADLVDFATITIDLELPPQALPDSGNTFLDRLAQLFGEFGDFLGLLGTWIVGIVLFGVPIVALAALLFWLLFGKIGLLVKLYRLIAKPKAPETTGEKA